MQIHLGMKIRELRRRDGRTQEMLADALGVTPQAVSRWESGGSYPDMEMIPSIANYFGITIDELFGYQNDRENTYCQEALSIYEKLLRQDISSEQRKVVVFSLIMLYQHLGHYEKARTLAEEQPSIILCREVLLAKTTTAEERDQYQGELIIALVTELCCAISNSILMNKELSASDYGKEIIIALIELFETIFKDGRCGTRHMDLRFLYLTLANLEARSEENMEKALTYFDKGFEHHKEYCRISTLGDYHYTAPLVAQVHLTPEWFQPVPEFFWKYHIGMVPDMLKNELRKNEKYSECFE